MDHNLILDIFLDCKVNFWTAKWIDFPELKFNEIFVIFKKDIMLVSPRHQFN